MKKIFSVLLSIGLFSVCLAESNPIIIEEQCDVKILTPSLAERKTIKLKLANQLEAYLISDPQSHQSAASLAVGVGSFEDPKERPGLAHFLEHMLFLGTKKYPEETEYTQFLNQYGGMRNAFTASDRTVYMFSINNDAFTLALDRFAQFFIAPLFNPSGIQRECIAVHQEYCKNIPLDQWRQHYVKKTQANPEHPFYHFDIGSLTTLKDVTRQELQTWYENHYSADIMHLVVVSPLPIDEIKELVINKFSEIPNKHVARQIQLPSVFSANSDHHLVYIEPTKQLQTLELCWELPPNLSSDLDIKPEGFASFILGHEGPQSLLADLKKAKLAEGLSTRNDHTGNDQLLFSLVVKLTALGVEKWESVAELCFMHLAALQKQALPQYIFDEVQKLAIYEYQFQPRKDLFEQVTELAYNMVDEPLDTFPKKTLIPSKFDPLKISQFFQQLNPNGCHFYLTAPSKIAKIKPTLKEKWMDVAYQLVNIPAQSLKKWNAITAKNVSVIPAANPYIPQKLEIIRAEQADQFQLPTPKVMIDDASGQLYFCQDDRFHIPEIAWTFIFKTPQIHDNDATSQSLADIFCAAIDENLTTVAYFAEIANLKYEIKTYHDGIKLILKGYSEKAEVLFKKIIYDLTHLTLSPDEFAQFKETLQRKYYNETHSTPLKQGIEALSEILYQDFATSQEKEIALQDITFADFARFNQTLWQNSYVAGMLFGNCSPQTVNRIWSDYKESFTGNPYSPIDQYKIKLATLNSRGPYYLVKKSKLPGNALILATDCGAFTFKRRAAQEILSKGMEEPFFSELRTRQQTAYIVKNWAKEMERELYAFFAIQSHSHDTRDLLSRFELFIESMVQNISTTGIPVAQFEAIRQASIYQLKHSVQNPQEMNEILSMLAFEYDGRFDWLDKRIEGLESLTYSEFLDLAQEFLGKANPKRVAICIDGIIPTESLIKYRKITPSKIKQDLQYKTK